MTSQTYKLSLKKVLAVSAWMTPEQVRLYRKPVEKWGTAADACARGADVLDRAMPGWADEVVINDLELSSSCSCVLGQIFAKPAEASNDGATVVDKEEQPVKLGHEYVDGYGVGLKVLGFRNSSEEGQHSKDVFLGFDSKMLYDSEDLTEAWKPLIEARQTKKVTA